MQLLKTAITQNIAANYNYILSNCVHGMHISVIFGVLCTKSNIEATDKKVKSLANFH